MGTRSSISIGPFSGGLNSVANTPDTIADNELAVCMNFDFTYDGTLQTRPPVPKEAITGNVDVDGFFINILGFYVDSSQNPYTIAEINQKLFYRLGPTTNLAATTSVWTYIIGPVGVCSAGIQYADKFYFVVEGTNGGSWSPSGGYVNVPSMPSGSSIQIFKERLWITGYNVTGTASRLYYSNIGTGSTWSGSDFVDIEIGNGQSLNTSFASANALYLFKSNSTYILTYDTLPARGTIQNISTTIGTANRHSIGAYEGTIFVLYGQNVYKLDGYTYSRISNKVAISRGVVESPAYNMQASLSVVGDRILIQFRDRYYCYYPITNTWTQWEITSSTKWYYIPGSIKKYGYGIYLSCQNRFITAVTSQVAVIQDTPNKVGIQVDPTGNNPRLRTKQYTLDSPSMFKRLHSWGADLSIDSQNVFPFPATLRAISPTVYTTSVVTFDSARKYVKANQSCRFLRLSFEVELTSYDYTNVSSIYKVHANVSQKQDPVSRSET